MNINTNYNVRNCYLNLSLKEQNRTSNKSTPAFKMSSKLLPRGLVTFALASIYTNNFFSKQKSGKHQEITIKNVEEFLDRRDKFDNDSKVRDIVYNHPKVIMKLLEIKNADGSQFFDEYDIIYGVLANNTDIISNNPEKIFAVLNNPQELNALHDENSEFDNTMFHWAVRHPLKSTREKNPGIFEPEETINIESVFKNIIDSNAKSDAKIQGLKALYANTELVEKLASLKDSAGHQFIGAMEIADFLCNIAKHLENKEQIDMLNNFLNNPNELDYVEDYYNRGVGLYKCFIG